MTKPLEMVVLPAKTIHNQKFSLGHNPMYSPQRFQQIDESIERLVDEGLLKENQPTLSHWLNLKKDAKTQGHLQGYLNCSGQLLAHYNHFFSFSDQKTEAIETLMILEDEDRARRIQGELSLDLYQTQRQFNAPFAYQMLLDAEGEINGFHSEEMRKLIEEGQQICRHLGCSTAKREFAAFMIDYHIDSGDWEEALSVASRLYHSGNQQVVDTITDCLIGRKLSQIHVLLGNPVAASKIAEDCYQRLPDNPLHPCGRLPFLIQWLVCRWLLDDGEGKFLPVAIELLEPELFPFAQGSIDHFHWDLAKSWLLAVGGSLSESSEILEHWDSRLVSPNPSSSWLEVRIRRIANLLALKKLDLAKSLCDQARSFANLCDNQFALRRIEFLWNREESFNPLAIPFRYSYRQTTIDGTFPGHWSTTGTSEYCGVIDRNIPNWLSIDEGDKSNDQHLDSLEDGLVELRQSGPPSEDASEAEIQEAEGSKNDWLEKLFGTQTDASWSGEQISKLLSLALQVHAEYDSGKLWSWATENSKNWNLDPTVISVLANLGAHMIADRAPEDHLWLEHQQIEKMFLRSISLAPENPGNLWRAGEYRFFRDDQFGSRRLLRNAFDLDPTEPRFALSLAIANDHWEFVGEALEILDVAIRSGQKDSSLIMAAVEKCVEFGLWNQIQTYLTRYFEVEEEPSLWAVYYGAMSCFELQQWELCQFYLLKTIQQDLPLTWHVHAIQTALLAKQLRQNDPDSVRLFKTAMEQLLDFPIFQTPVVTANIAEEGWDRLWRSVYPAILQFPDLEKTFIDRLLSAGCLPPEYFEERRKSSKPKEIMSVFRVVFRQRLDEFWETELTRRHDQQEMEQYYAEWLVAAKDKQWAIDQATMWQSRCHSGELEVIDVQSEGGFYQWEGVLFQGQRGIEYDPGPEE